MTSQVWSEQQSASRWQGHSSAEPRTISALLRARGIDIDEIELVAAVDEMLDQTLAAYQDAPLTAAEVEYLTDHTGSATTAPVSDPAGGRKATAREATRMAVTSLTTADAAARAGVEPATVRHWIHERAVVTLAGARRGRRLPLFQFGEDGRPLPGLRDVLADLPEMHPLEVEGFMTTPDPDLRIGDTATSPRDWLLRGGDPAAVVTLAAGVDDLGGTRPEESRVTTTGPNTDNGAPDVTAGRPPG